MGIFNTVMGDTIGLGWRALSGTVDPWTKDAIVEDTANAIVVASGGTIKPEDARVMAERDATVTLQTTPSGSADPSDFIAGTNRSLKSLIQGGNALTDTADRISHDLLLVAFAVAIGSIVYFVFLTPEGKSIRKTGARAWGKIA